MFTLSNLLLFVLAAALVAASGVLLLSHSSCPCDVDATHNGAQTHPGIRSPGKVHNGAQTHPGIRSPGKATVARKEDADDLAQLLRKAAMEDNTIIMTFTNEAWTTPGSLLDLFLESFRVGDKTEPLLKHLVIVTVDGKAFEQCKRVHPFCYSFDAGGGMNLAKEQKFMSGDYLEMMWARNRFQNHVLELGFSFVFTDVDIVWFRNPLLRIPLGADIAISSDKFDGDDPYDLGKRTNGGFVSARSNARTLAFFQGWHEARKAYPGLNEQDVFEKVKHELSTRVGAAVHFVDTAHFGGFCEPKKDFRQLCTFHGNCVKGLKWKLKKLRGVMGEWKRFKDARDRVKKNCCNGYRARFYQRATAVLIGATSRSISFLYALTKEDPKSWHRYINGGTCRALQVVCDRSSVHRLLYSWQPRLSGHTVCSVLCTLRGWTRAKQRSRQPRSCCCCPLLGAHGALSQRIKVWRWTVQTKLVPARRSSTRCRLQQVLVTKTTSASC